MFTVITCVALTVALLAAALTLALCQYAHSRHKRVRWFHGLAGALAAGLLLSGALWCRDALSDLSFEKVVGVDLVPITLLSTVSAGVIAGLVVVRICRRRFEYERPVAS